MNSRLTKIIIEKPGINNPKKTDPDSYREKSKPDCGAVKNQYL